VSSRPRRGPTLFLDRNLGGHIVADLLREAEIPFQRHDDVLPSDAPDEDWIELCAQHDWIAVTRDKRIRYRHAEIEAIVASRAAVVVIRSKTATGQSMGALLVAAYPRITRFAADHARPFIVGLDGSGRLRPYELT
jgi:hypothetical protein